MFSVCRFLLQCAIERRTKKRPSLDQEFGKVCFFPVVAWGIFGDAIGHEFWGWGRKRENWSVEDKDTWTICWYQEHISTCKGEFLSLQNKAFLLMFCMEEKGRGNWCGKKEELYAWMWAGLAGVPQQSWHPWLQHHWGGGWLGDPHSQSP